MAFYTNINSFSVSHLRTFARKIILHPSFYFSSHQPFDHKEDVLDDFTSQLMQRKISKWENKKMFVQRTMRENKFMAKVTGTTAQIKAVSDISSLNINEINWLFQKAIDFDDTLTIIDLTKQCVNYNKIPSLMILLQTLSCSRNGDKDTIVEIANLCEKLRPEILQENSYFEHYLAEAIWIKGNTTKSLEIFEKVYRENVYLRRRIRCILKYLILDIVTNHSEATLVTLIRFSEMLLKEYDDPFALACIWQSCFLSEWFTDQQLALELLERNSGLCKAVVSKIPYVVRVSLKHDRIEAVYRLTEVLLKFKIESELVQVLLALLDYWIKEGDLSQCNEIIEWSIKNNIALPTVMNNTKLMKRLNNGREIEVKSVLSVPKRPQTEYKF